MARSPSTTPRSAPPLLALLLLAGAALAGCLAADPNATPAGDDDGVGGGIDGRGAITFDPDWARHALPSGDGHDHTDPSQHEGLTTPNVEVLGHDPLVSDDYGTTPRGNLCGDALPTEDGRRLAAVESRGDVAFTLVDVTDPAEPARLGELVMRTTYVYDLAVVPDGEHVVLITSLPKTPHNGPDAPTAPTEGDAFPGLAWRSACTGGDPVPLRFAGPVAEWAPLAPMTLLVDITDPSEPAIVDARPATGAGHSIHSADVDGRLWVLSSSYGNRAGSSTFQFFEVADGPQGATLEHLSTVPGAWILPPALWDRSMGHNDGWIRMHPGLEAPVAYLVLWDAGLVMLDLSDPVNPNVLGQWDDHDPDRDGDDSGNIHSAHPLPDLWDGRHYTIVGPEIIGHPQDTPTGAVRVLDTTDPSDIHEVAAWTLPHDVTWDGRLQFSNHYLTAHGRTAFVSMYHGGVWALDLSTVRPGNFTLLDSVGVFMPVAETGVEPDDPFRWAPTIEDVHAFDDGSLVAFDSNTGVWSFRFDADRPAPAPEPWELEPVDLR